MFIRPWTWVEVRLRRYLYSHNIVDYGCMDAGKEWLQASWINSDLENHSSLLNFRSHGVVLRKYIRFPISSHYF